MDLKNIINSVKQYPTSNVDLDIRYLKSFMENYEDDSVSHIDLNPEFQRGHVWTKQQQIAFLENLIRGCQVNNIIYFNDLYGVNPNIIEQADERIKNKCVVVDGLQRLTSIIDFIDGKIKLFDNQVSFNDIKEHEDKVFMRQVFNQSMIKIRTIHITNYAELLEFYINFNSGGTVHSETEIQRIKDLLEKEKS